MVFANKTCCRDQYKSSQLRVIGGDHDISLKNDTESTLLIETIFIHPDYMLDRQDNNDIALIKVKSGFEFRQEVAPVCLPETGAPNGTCVMTGWKHNHGECANCVTVNMTSWCLDHFFHSAMS